MIQVTLIAPVNNSYSGKKNAKYMMVKKEFYNVASSHKLTKADHFISFGLILQETWKLLPLNLIYVAVLIIST